MKILKWSFGENCQGKDLVIGKNLMLSIGQYEGLQFSTCGLGLSKFEREIFNSKFLKRRNIVNIYIGKLIITHDKNGYKDNLSSCDINWEMNLKDYIKNRYKHSFKPNMEKKINNLISKVLKKTLFKKKEVFVIQPYYEKARKIKCDRLTAYQLASNYEADLIQNGKYLLSPLGFDWEENKNLIVKHLGKICNNYKLHGYAHWYDVEVL